MTAAIGYLYALIAVILYGTNLVPLKSIDIGDGFFFQLIMALSIWITSLPLAIIYQEFKAIALLGGFVWCTGNMICFIVIKLIGVGLGVLIWGTAAMLTGSLTSKWGLFGLERHDNTSNILYFIGISLTMLGLTMFLYVKTDGLKTHTHTVGDGNISGSINTETDDLLESPLLPRADHVYESINTTHSTKYNNNKDNSNSNSSSVYIIYDMDTWSEAQRKGVGAVLAITAGVLFGSCFDFSQYSIENPSDSYVFSHFTGILVFSWLYFVIYCIYMKVERRPPFMSTDIIFASSLSGLLWGVAGICQFLGNEKLGFQIAFPIICSGPGFVSALWSVLYFGEIRGRANVTVLVGAFAVTVVGIVLITKSV